jgi:hydrogenase-4 component E
VTPAQLASLLESLNALVGGLFLVSAFAMVATRQTRGCLQFFIAQSLLLATSAFLLGVEHRSWHLVAVGVVNIGAKAVVIPWILGRTISAEVYTRREIDQALNIPTSLLIALALAIFAYFLTRPVLNEVAPEFRSDNVPLIGILAMENGAFFAGIALSRDLPLIVELAIASDGLILVFVTGVLVRAIQIRIGSTRVGALTVLREERAP